MNLYRNKNYFNNQIYHYFNLTHATVYINNRTKKRIYLTGTGDKIMSSLFLIFGLVFIIIGSINVSKISSIGNYAYLIGMIIWLITTFFVILKRSQLHKKLIPKSTNINLYERNLPSNLKPAHVRFLLNDGLVDELSLAATLLDLVDRGYLKLEYYNKDNDSLKSQLFKNKNIILMRTNKPTDNLLEYEKYLLDWFLGYNDGISITSEALHNGLNADTYDDLEFPSDKMTFFSSLVLMSFPLEEYFNKVKENKKALKYVLFIFLGFLPIFSYFGQILATYSLGILLFANPTYSLNQKGVNLISSYLNLKKYLQDFSSIKDKNSQMVELWNYYLTYSIALEIKSVASLELKNFFGKNIFNELRNKSINFTSEDIKRAKVDLNELQISTKEWNHLFEIERKKGT